MLNISLKSKLKKDNTIETTKKKVIEKNLKNKQ